MKHGFLARVLPESTPGWKDLLEGLYKSLRPADETQQLLVDQIAIAYVRLSRIYEAEQRAHKLPPYVASHMEELQRNAQKADPSARQYLGTIVDLARQVGDLHLASAYYGSNAARTMARYESTLNRQIQRNLNLLWLLQSRAPEPAEPPPFRPFEASTDPEPAEEAPKSDEPPENDYDPGYSNEMAGLNTNGTIGARRHRPGGRRRGRGR